MTYSTKPCPIHRAVVSRDEWVQLKSSALLVLVLLALSIPANAQGCSQCRETVGQTPARTQTAYRRAITLMIVAGATVFGAGLLTLRRYRE